MKVTLEQAVNLIKNGETVAIPTETVYGLAADAFNINAVKKIFDQKGRPAENPLIVHISNLGQLQSLVSEFPADAKRLTDKFWPGPLSIVLKKKKRVPDIVTGGLDTVAIRMPNHSETLALIEQTGPLTAPSANKSGRPSPTKPAHVEEDFGSEMPILDGGPTKLGLESTVLDLSSDRITILRPGYVDSWMIEKLFQKEVHTLDTFDYSSAKKSPGTRFTHYKPKAEVLWLESPISEMDDSDQYYLIHSKNKTVSESKNLYAYNGDYENFAHDLYDHFRTADHLSCSRIYIEPFDDRANHPLIDALKDRIGKAIE